MGKSFINDLACVDLQQPCDYWQIQQQQEHHHVRTLLWGILGVSTSRDASTKPIKLHWLFYMIQNKKKKQTCKHHCLTDDQETRKDQRIITLAVCSRVAAEWQWFVTDTASLGQTNFQKRKKKVSSLTRVSCDYIISISLLNASMEIFCILTHI